MSGRTSTSGVRKVVHDLHLASTADEVAQRLRQRSVDLDGILTRYGMASQTSGVLVVGSLAEGLGTARSDLDLLVLLEGDVPRRRLPRAAMRTESSFEILVYRHGIEINIEVLRRSTFADALRALIEVAPAMYEPWDLEVLPILGPTEQRLLHRLRSGWPIRGHHIVEQWRDEFLVTLLPPYLALFHLIGFNELLEDVAATTGCDDDGSFSLVVKECATEGLLCLLALEGVTNQTTKWLARLARRVLMPSDPTAFELAMPLLYLPRAVALPDQRRAAEMLARLGRGIHARMRDDKKLRIAVEHMLRQIHYTT